MKPESASKSNVRQTMCLAMGACDYSCTSYLPRSVMDTQALSRAVDAAMPLAQKIFDDVRAKTADVEGVSREPYTAGEQAATDRILVAACGLNLDIAHDPFGNAYLTMRGSEP